MSNLPITIGISGASGAPYSLRLLHVLTAVKQPVLVLVSNAAREVFRLEMNMELPKDNAAMQKFLCEYCECNSELISVYGEKQWISPVASGSGAPRRMVICPASSSTVAAIAHGMSDNLLERAADVVLKERGQLIVVHRETPLSIIHLQNLLALAKAGATVLPASPGFYQQPKTINDLIDFVVARILNQLNIPQQLLEPWGM